MNPVILPAIHGWLWVLRGFRLFRPYAALWLLLLFFYLTLIALVSVVPVVGPLLTLCVVPGVSAGWMVACRASQERLPPTLKHIFEPFQVNRQAQFRLGLGYMAGFMTALLLSALFDGGLFLRVWLFGYGGDSKQAGTLYPGILGFTLLLTPVLLGFWFAPALVHWRGMAPGKAVFFSFFAGLRNWRALLVYVLGWMFFLFGGILVLATIFAVLLPADMRSLTIASFVIVPYYFAVLGALFCSFYAGYCAIFPEAPPADEPLSAPAA
ncbi:MAG TPA: BPSS1780 family membrane protein [Burkholderiales bacterium]|jgi:hypothetical protein